jgi:tRNA-2-methylthio-N6-dimethylallyladenosine synthase
MGRRYTKEEYLELYKKIRDNIEGVSITTDIIVGFPSETEEDFKETLDLVNKCKFDGAFTFIYSPREGTPAAVMDNQVDESVKSKRLKELNKIINKYSNESNKKMEGTIQKCLILGVSEKDSNKVMGYTENMKLVNIKAPKDTIGKIIDVKIEDAKSFSLDGVIVK